MVVVIGLTGTIASGKGIVSGILKSKGFDVVVLSSVIKEYVNENNIPINRKNLQDAGNHLRKTYGGQVLAERALAKYPHSKKIVIDGIRNLDEIDYLRNYAKTNKLHDFKFILIGVDASLDVRWERVKKRNKDNDLLDYDKFVVDDARDQGNGEPLNGQQVRVCIAHADHLIHNDDEFENLEDSSIYRETIEILTDALKK